MVLVEVMVAGLEEREETVLAKGNEVMEVIVLLTLFLSILSPHFPASALPPLIILDFTPINPSP